MSEPKTLTDLTSATSLPESAGGPLPCGSQDTSMFADCGPAPVPASPSLPPVNEKEPLMPDTSGLKCAASSRSAALAFVLESKLRARMEGRGAPEYVLTWKHWDMPSGPPICALRASGRRISDNGSGGVGWPTPNHNSTGPGNQGRKGGLNLQTAVQQVPVGWATPCANQANSTPENFLRRKRESVARTGRSMGICLSDLNMQAQAYLTSGWATPTVPRAHGSDNTAGNGQCKQMDIYKQLLGPRQSLSPAPTERPAGLALNPRFSLWLMGYPDEWASCGARAMQSCRNSRQSSSSPS